MKTAGSFKISAIPEQAAIELSAHTLYISTDSDLSVSSPFSGEFTLWLKVGEEYADITSLSLGNSGVYSTSITTVNSKTRKITVAKSSGTVPASFGILATLTGTYGGQTFKAKDTISIVANKQGVKGDTGNDAVVYSIVCDHSQLCIGPDMKTVEAYTFTFYKTIGGVTSYAYPAGDGAVVKVKGHLVEYGESPSTWITADDGISGCSYTLSKGIKATDIHSGLKRMEQLKISATFVNGEDTQVLTFNFDFTYIGLPMEPHIEGPYEAQTYYVNNGLKSPVVYVKSGNTTYYYRLFKLFDKTDLDPTLDTNSDHWKHVDSSDLMIVEQLLADWAKIGDAVFSNGYLISQKGVANGAEDDYYNHTDCFTGGELNGSFIPHLYLDLVKGSITTNRIIPRMATYDIANAYASPATDVLVKQMSVFGSWNLSIIPHVTSSGTSLNSGYPAAVILPDVDSNVEDGAGCQILYHANSAISTNQYGYTYAEECSVLVIPDRTVIDPTKYKKVNEVISWNEENARRSIIWKGWKVRFVILQPGMMLKLRACKVNGTTYWYVENTEDFANMVYYQLAFRLQRSQNSGVWVNSTDTCEFSGGDMSSANWTGELIIGPSKDGSITDIRTPSTQGYNMVFTGDSVEILSN